MAFEQKYMKRAIELAKKGIGAVNPNPLVGAVIVKNGKVIGEGYHAKYGDLHAERNAFKNLTESAEGAEMYVTLEPCCHHGKQPPCVEAIVEHKIACVYVGSDDPNEQVAGKGIAYLREHGITVETGIMKRECDELNPVFFHYITTKIPYVMMKYAMTMDGKIASYTGASQWISCEESRHKVQEMRRYYYGIMVGIGTVLSDDPMLTCRLSKEEYTNVRNPIRIVCDTNLQIPSESNLVKTAKEYPTLVVCGLPREVESKKDEVSFLEYKNRKMTLEQAGVTVIEVSKKDGHLNLSEMMEQLGKLGIDGIMLEGGGTLAFNMIKEGFVKEIKSFIAPKILGGKDAKTPVEGLGFENPDFAKLFEVKEVGRSGEDIFVRYESRI